MQIPLLSLLLTLPALGIALVWLWPRPGAARVITLTSMLATLCVALLVVLRFDPLLAEFQFVERHVWIPGLDIHYHVGVDGISLLFLPATALLCTGALLATWNAVHGLVRLYCSLLLLLEIAVLGVFCALDTVLFYLFWELTLIPLYFLISLWGTGPRRRHAATQYLLVMLAGGTVLLFGLLVLAFSAATDGRPVFDLPRLLTTHLPADRQTLVFLLLLVGFGVKVPLFPFHTWLPLVTLEGPAAVAALLTGLKLGAYGLLRFAVPLAPDAAREFHWLLAGLGAATLLFGALAALAQTNLRRMLGYASLSHVGLVVLGIASLNLQGVQGAVMQLLNFSLSTAALFLLAGFLHHRVGTTDIARLGGTARSLPLLSSFFLFFGLAGMGIPGTSGFPAELLLLVSAFATHTGAALAALLGVVLGAAYFIHLYRQAFFGSPTNPALIAAQDLRPRELGLMLTFAGLALIFGIRPALILDLLLPAAQAWTARLG